MGIPKSSILRGFAHVRPFQMGHNQAQEGRAGRQARQDFHPPDQGNHHGGQERRRRRKEPAPAHRRGRGQGREHAGRQHQARHPARHRRVAGRHLRRDHLRRLRSRRRGHPGRSLDRQPQPHRQRNPSRLLQERRQHGCSRIGRLHVPQEGRHRHRQSRRPRKTT